MTLRYLQLTYCTPTTCQAHTYIIWLDCDNHPHFSGGGIGVCPWSYCWRKRLTQGVTQTPTPTLINSHPYRVSACSPDLAAVPAGWEEEARKAHEGQRRDRTQGQSSERRKGVPQRSQGYLWFFKEKGRSFLSEPVKSGPLLKSAQEETGEG